MVCAEDAVCSAFLSRGDDEEDVRTTANMGFGVQAVMYENCRTPEEEGGYPPPPGPPSPPPFPTFEADSQNFASAPSVPRGFKRQNFLPAFGGDRRPSTPRRSQRPPKAAVLPPPSLSLHRRQVVAPTHSREGAGGLLRSPRPNSEGKDLNPGMY